MKTKRKEANNVSDEENMQVHIVPTQDFGYDQDIDSSSDELEEKPQLEQEPEQQSRWSKRYQRRNPRTGKIIGKAENPAAKFIDLEAVHDTCSESESESSSEDESDGSLKEFVTSEQESESEATEKSQSSSSSSSDFEASDDSFIELKPIRMKKHVKSNNSIMDDNTKMHTDSPFDVEIIPRDTKHKNRDKMDDLMTIQEGRSIVSTGYAFPQSANLKHWYFKPEKANVE